MLGRIRLRRGAVFALTAAIGLAAIGGISVATGAIPSGDGTVHACYGNGDGSLRVRDVEAGKPCPRNFSPIEWSQQGPAGTPGQDGADGQDGAPGPRGPSDIYTTYRQFADSLPDTSDPYDDLFSFGREPVLKLDVPAGSYDIQAKGFANGDAGNVGCVLVAEQNVDGTIATLPNNFTAESLVMQVTHVFDNPGRIELRCTDYGGNGQRHLKWIKLHATKVETIHVLDGTP
jgi:hypothetical protein